MKKLILGLMMALAANAALAEFAPATDFEFSNGTITEYKGLGGNVEIPPTINGVPVTSIGDLAFWNCDKITSVAIPEGVTSIGGAAFSYCDKLKSATIPHGVTSVSGGLFAACQSLENVIIPESVTSIDDYAFSGCASLTNVRIPAVTNIGVMAFSSCSKLTKAVVLADNPPSVGTCFFQGVGDGCRIYVPKESVDKYKAADGWGDHADKISGIDVVSVRIVAGAGVAKVEFRRDDMADFCECPSDAMELIVGTTVDLRVTTAENYRYTGVTRITVPDKDVTYTITATEIAPGDKDRPWSAGDTVTAYTNGVGGLIIDGTGAMSNFVDAASVPWAAVADDVTMVTVAEGVTLGKNSMAGLDDTVMVNGLTIASFSSAVGSSGQPIPEDQVLVLKTELQAAKAEAVTVENGVVTLAVGVSSNGNFTAETKDWKPVELTTDNVEVKGGKIVISIPVGGDSGFMILQSGDATISPAN